MAAATAVATLVAVRGAVEEGEAISEKLVVAAEAVTAVERLLIRRRTSLEGSIGDCFLEAAA